MVEQITYERWASIGETVNGWRGSLASGRCSYDWSLNAANAKNQIGTELSDQVVYVNTRVDADDQPLKGANNYILHFEAGQTPPVAGMWNLAMYDDGMFFIANEIDPSVAARRRGDRALVPERRLRADDHHGAGDRFIWQSRAHQCPGERGRRGTQRDADLRGTSPNTKTPQSYGVLRPSNPWPADGRSSRSIPLARSIPSPSPTE